MFRAILLLGVVGLFILVQRHAAEEEKARTQWIEQLKAESAAYEVQHMRLRDCMNKVFAQYSHRYPKHYKLTLMTREQRRAYDASSAAQRECQRRF